MKTQVLMKRSFFNGEISQQSKTEFFSATDLVVIANNVRRSLGKPIFNLSQFLKQKNTIEFIEELNNKYGNCIATGKGRNSVTWVHPLLFIEIALAIDPKFKIEVYEWLYDNLIKFRNDSGDSFKEMSASLFKRCTSISKFPEQIQEVAKEIKKACKVNDWQSATEEQLKLRDNIHRSIKTLSNVLTDIKQIVRIAINEHIY